MSLFYWKPHCTTSKRARAVLDELGLDPTLRDIEREPPSRAFLERHIDARNFLQFVTTRSPVWKTRPLPATKREAIELMVANPNLIRRPILIVGPRVVFGFDRGRYAALRAPR
jgi:arsenate reductase